MKKEERLALLESYMDFPARLCDEVEALPAEALTHRPAIAGAWTIHEHVIHLVDMELNAYLRLKKAIAEPGTTVMVLDEEAWADKLGYEGEDLDANLELYALIRYLAGGRLGALGDSPLWREAWYEHPTMGRVDLEHWLGHYEGHGRAHYDYIKRNVADYESR
jgi:hypothetical protein